MKAKEMSVCKGISNTPSFSSLELPWHPAIHPLHRRWHILTCFSDVYSNKMDKDRCRTRSLWMAELRSRYHTRRHRPTCHLLLIGRTPDAPGYIQWCSLCDAQISIQSQKSEKICISMQYFFDKALLLKMWLKGCLRVSHCLSAALRNFVVWCLCSPILC